MQRGEIGRYEVTSTGGERIRAFVPAPLPSKPALVLGGSLSRVHEVLKARPILSVREIRNRTTLSFPTASSAMELLVEHGIAREITGKRRDRLFVYDQYLSILNEGTEAEADG